MDSNVHEMEWFAGALRAWHLAILRYAVTLDNADRLAVHRIAREIDRLYPRRQRGFRIFPPHQHGALRGDRATERTPLRAPATLSGPD
jgi:hypothetical protein